MVVLCAEIMGPDGSPYEKGVFRLEIEIPERYGLEIRVGNRQHIIIRSV